jgi:hypothetical protein
MPDFGGLVGHWNVEVSVLWEGGAALAVVLLAQDGVRLCFRALLGSTLNAVSSSFVQSCAWPLGRSVGTRAWRLRALSHVQPALSSAAFPLGACAQ